MSWLLNPFRFGKEELIVADVYGVAGSPSPLIPGDNVTTYRATNTANQTSSASAGSIQRNGRGGTVDGAILNHTDPNQYLYGYRVYVGSATIQTTIEFALYDVTGGFSGNRPIVAASKVSAVIPANVQSVYVPLPAPIALETGKKYALARSSGSWAGSTALRVFSYAQNTSLPANAGVYNFNTHPLPASYPIGSGTAVEGPYWIKTIMMPLQTNPAVVLNFATRYDKTYTTTPTLPITQAVTLNQAMSGNRAVVVNVSAYELTARPVISITLNGVEGLMYAQQPGGSISGAIAFFPASVGLAAGSHPLVITHAAGGPTSYGAFIEVFEFDNIHQNEEFHYYGHTFSTSSGASEFRALSPAPTRYYDGAVLTARGGSTTVGSPEASSFGIGVVSAHAEFVMQAAEAGPPLRYMKPVPVMSPTECGIYYGMGFTTSPHCLVLFMPARA